MSDKRKQDRESKTIDFTEQEERTQKTPATIRDTHPSPPRPKTGPKPDKPSKKD